LADENGAPTEQLIRLYERLSKGGVGAIITGFIGVTEESRSTDPGMSLLDADDKIPAYAEMTGRVHQAGGVIIAQLAHCGGSSKMGKAGRPDNLSVEQIMKIEEDFVKAAKRAKAAGFDGIELHTAHGYLLSGMLSGSTNHRKDAYGGSEENRFRMLGEILKKLRDELPDYPIYVKYNGTEKSAKGIHKAEAVEIAKRLEKAGASVIEVSSNQFSENLGPLRGNVPVDMILHSYPGIKNLPGFVKKPLRPVIKAVKKPDEPQHLYNVPVAKAIKEAVSIPVIVCGGIRSKADMEQVICAEGLDAVSICRPLILEADLVNKYKTGKTTEPKCIECNHCIIGIMDAPVRCYYGKTPK
jgi:2,4-dienoyl-CoA reductase-like NADH-dependent reductase (Old Yellow Enzyme family)